MTVLQKLIEMSSKYKCCILCSDQNHDLHKVQSHRHMQSFISYMYKNGFTATILKSTQVTYSSSTLIDNIYVKNATMNKQESYMLT